MKNDLIVKEIRGVMTRIEPLTEELFDAACPDMSFSEFQALLDEYGLSMEYIVHDPTRHFLSTIYADCQHGRYLELYLSSKYLRDTLRNLLTHFSKEGDTVQELTDYAWEKYYSRRVPLPMLIHDFQLRYQDIPAGEVFNVWYSIHKRIDYANGMWRPEVLDYVLSHAPATELPAAGPDGLITLYRGMGALSQPPEQALSWSSSPVSALWFATHFARGTHIVTTRVHPDQIVHYTSSCYNENEVLVRPGTIIEYSYIAFQTAEALAESSGIPKDSPERIDAGLLFTLQTEEGKGHLCMHNEAFINNAVRILDTPGLDRHTVARRAYEMLKSGRLVLYRDHTYRPIMAQAEAETAACIAQMLSQDKLPYMGDLDDEIDRLQVERGSSSPQSSAMRSRWR